MGDELSRRSREEESDFSDSFLLYFREPPELLVLPRPGEVLGGQHEDRFELRARLGQGGMGQVFRAWDRVLQRNVALKFIQPQEEGSGLALTSLLREEARAIARLDHDNIIRIFDVSEWRAGPSLIIPFLVMECLEGQSLSARLRKGPLEWDHALRVFRDVLAGLAHAHAHHVIHRDLKPGNIFVLDEGRTKLLDFGLAHLAANPGNASAHEQNPRGGSPPYMAPEQWLDGPQDARTDIWASGLLLYELLTGQHPHAMASREELRRWALTPQPLPSVRTHRPELPAEVDTLIARAIANEPARRFQSVHELAKQLRAIEQRWEAARKAPPPARRGQVTFLCCVMARPPEPLDDEALGELQERFQKACSECLQRHGATMLHSMGDEVLACLGHPRAEEDTPLHAVRAALELASLPCEGFAVRVGLHTASIVMNTLSSARHSGASASVQGDAHLVAAWVARQAEVGTALLSQSTLQGLRGAFITEPIPSDDSTRGPHSLHRLIREREETLRFERMRPASLTPLVGRSEELRQLRELWERTRRGQGALVLLQGEAGIGKSRLIWELREQVAAEVGVQAQAQCWEETRTSPLYPICQLLPQLLAHPRDASPEQRRRRTIHRLEALGLAQPEQLALLDPLLDLSGHEVSPVGGAERRQVQLLELLITLLLELAGARSETARPALLIIEDLHWADPSTLDLLTRLGEQLRSARLCVLLSARLELQSPWPLVRGARSLVLPRLSSEQTLDLAARVTAGQHLSQETLRLVHEKTDGIPLFIEELARMLGPGIPIPLQSLLQARLDSLPPGLRELAQRCAVISREFTPSLAAACMAPEAEPPRRELEGLVRTGLLRQYKEEHDVRYGFRHALLQEQARESLPGPERRLVHQRIARHLVAHPMELPGLPPECVAHHFTEAREWAEAFRWWTDAGRQAMRRLAYTEAVHHYQRARAMLGHLPPELRQGMEPQLLLELGMPMFMTQCSVDEVKAIFLRARDLCLRSGTADQLPSALSGLFFWYLERGDYPEALGVASNLLEVGERICQPEARAVGALRMSICLLLQGMPRRALEHLERARELLGPDFELEHEQKLCLAYCYSPRVLMHIFSALSRLLLEGPGSAAWSDSEQALSLVERLRNPMTESLVLAYVGLFYQLCGEEERTLALTSRIAPLMARYNLSSCAGIAEVLHAWVLEKRGEAGGLRASIKRWEASGMRKGLSYCFALLADLHLGRGESESGLDAVREAQKWEESLGEHICEAELLHLKGRLLWMRGDTDAARACLHKALRVSQGQEARYFEHQITGTLERLR
ncbi:protein kinase [Archangium violaceum]|uniref:protein kinase domain-containing protein n=1 Tax=Archangium violaceum TaxID=83451 RepID=UPI0037BFBEAA